MIANQAGQTAGGHYFGVRSKFVDQALQNAIHQAQVAKEQACLNAADRGAANDLGGLANIDQRKARRVLKESARGNADAGRDDAAKVLAFAGNCVKGGCGAQIDYHARRSEEHTSELQSRGLISYAV